MMKKLFKKTIENGVKILFSFGLLFSFHIASAQIVNIPDANFKARILAHGTTFNPSFQPSIGIIDTNQDGEIQVSEAQAYTGQINASSIGMSDLTGLEAFIALRILRVNNNTITSLDLSSNLAIEHVFAEANQITEVDVSSLTSIKRLEVNNNALVSLNVANGNNGNNTTNDFYFVDARNNPNLTCIQKDSNFSPNPSTSYWYKDAIASWSNVPCPCPNTINFPDANFKNALLAHGTTITGTGIAVIDTDGDGEICQAEAENYTGYTIDVNNQNISDLTGIEAFTDITRLFCNSNSLTTIDVSNNTNLIFFYCNSNNLTNIDVSNNTNLAHFRCTGMPSLSSIDLSNNTGLSTFRCQYSGLTSLDVSNNTSLYSLNCRDNALTSLNVANGNNGAGSLELNYVYAIGNPNLSCIQHDAGFAPTTVSTWEKDATVSWGTSCCTSPVTSTDINAACDNLTWLDGITYTSSNNTATFTYPNATASGCDSIVTLNLTINETPVVTISQNGNILEATPGLPSYSWFNAATGAISGANSATFTPTASGDYFVEVDNNGCVGTSNTVSVSITLVTSITVEGQNGDSTISTNGGTLQMNATVLPANADDGSFTWSVVNGTGSATIDANGLLTAAANGTVDVIATANDSSGETGSKTITISNQTVGINDLAFENVNVYPNPAKEVLNIELANEELSSIRLIDLFGRTVKVFNTESKQLDISVFTQGIYFLEIANAERKSVVKILKK